MPAPRSAFRLAPDVAHVNHGSFGAVPRVVAEAQASLRRRADANPMRFHRVERFGLTALARARAAAFVGADEVALVRNVTESIATVLSSLDATGRLGPGTAVVSASSGYVSVELAIDAWCERTGARHVRAHLPVSATDDEVVAAYATALDGVDRPALVVVDQVVSPTGAVLPVADVVQRGRAAGAVTFVDAAHVPGHLPTRPPDVGADYWTGTLHKWAYAVPGTSVLWVAEAERVAVRPLTTGANHGLPFPLPFDLTGTDDRSPWWSLPAALDLWADLGGWDAVARGTDLLDRAVEVLTPVATAAPVPTPAPRLRLLALPDGVATTPEAAARLYLDLSACGVEAQVLAHAGRGWLRLSAAPYNVVDDYVRLAEVLEGVLGSSSGSSATTS